MALDSETKNKITNEHTSLAHFIKTNTKTSQYLNVKYANFSKLPHSFVYYYSIKTV